MLTCLFIREVHLEQDLQKSKLVLKALGCDIKSSFLKINHFYVLA